MKRNSKGQFIKKPKNIWGTDRKGNNYCSCIRCSSKENKYNSGGLCIACYHHLNHIKNKGRINQRHREHEQRQEIKSIRKKQKAEYYSQNKKEIDKKHRVYYSNTKDKKREYASTNRSNINKINRERYKRDINFRLNLRLATKIGESLRGNKKGLHWETLVGYNLQDLKGHLEKQFKKGMTWDNYGTYWHIDHRIPLSWFKFNKSNDSEFKKCWALDNLQPKKAKDNLIKQARYAEPNLKQIGVI